MVFSAVTVSIIQGRSSLNARDANPWRVNPSGGHVTYTVVSRNMGLNSVVYARSFPVIHSLRHLILVRDLKAP